MEIKVRVEQKPQMGLFCFVQVFENGKGNKMKKQLLTICS